MECTCNSYVFFFIAMRPKVEPYLVLKQKGAIFFGGIGHLKPLHDYGSLKSYKPGFDQHILVTLTCFSTQENQDVVSNILQYFLF